MTRDEAETLGVPEEERRFLVRLDSGKVNIVPPLYETAWFELIGVPLNNKTDMYPHGDNVQTVAPWDPPSAFSNTTTADLNKVLDEIATGMPGGARYSRHHNARSRAAWKVIVKHIPSKAEGPARLMIQKWFRSGVLIEGSFFDEERREEVMGLDVDPTRRPK